MSKRIEDLPRFSPGLSSDAEPEMHRDISGDWINLHDLPNGRDTRKDPPPNGFYFGQWTYGDERETNIAWVVNGEWFAINEEGVVRRKDTPDFWCEILCWGHLGRKS